jgi:hypothetical protein
MDRIWFDTNIIGFYLAVHILPAISNSVHSTIDEDTIDIG